MSGITGIFRRDGKDADPADIKKMNDKIAHRGPDGSRVWCEGPVALGHQMLHTTPESLHEVLPFEDAESGLVITADARIDNRKDLAPRLGIEDNEYVSDSYFILKAYEKWGEKCPEELLGDFAFAIWDKNKERLFCARDHMGVKPFYYFLSDDIFLFATDIKAILTLPHVPREINELKIALYLKQIKSDKKLTFYKNIYSLSASSSLTLKHNISKRRTYWKLDHDTQITLNSDKDYFTEYRKIFSEAVNCRLRSAFPVGSDLSGGLDSSSIVCMAKRILKDKNQHAPDFTTFSHIYDDFPDSDERYYINKVIDVSEFKSNLIKCDEISPLKEVENILYYIEQPFFSPFVSIWNNAYNQFQKKNVRIHLSGNGGDFIISSGNGYFIELFAALKLKRLLAEIKATSEHKNISFCNEFAYNLLFPLIPNEIKSKIVPFWRKYQNNRLPSQELIYSEPSDFLNKDLAKELKINNFSNENIWKDNARIKTAKRAHYNSIFGIPEQETFEMIDKLSSKFSVECRFPYFDIRLIEFCYAIPTEMKFRFGWNRYIQRASLTDILPKEVQWRTDKADFIRFLKTTIFKFENGRLLKLLNSPDTKISEYVDLGSLNDVYQNYQTNNNIAYLHAYNIWKIMLLNQWLKYI